MQQKQERLQLLVVFKKFTTTKSASRGELTFQVDYDPGTGAGPGKTDQPFIQFGYEVGASIQALVAPGHNLTPAEKKLYDDVYAARTSTDIINVVEPAYNGRTITDTNAKIPVSVNKTTYYKVVDKNNPTFNASKLIQQFKIIKKMVMKQTQLDIQLKLWKDNISQRLVSVSLMDINFIKQQRR